MNRKPVTPGRGERFDERGLRTVTRLRPEDWLNAAQARLVDGGIDAVKIGPLAADLKVTRGSFYWHFRDRNHLLQALLARWQAQSHEMFNRLGRRRPGNGHGRVRTAGAPVDRRVGVPSRPGVGDA